MKYATLCSGIEAPSMGWHDLGWNPVFFSEIEPFPKAVLKHHYPNVPDYGDMTKYKEWKHEPVDLICAGTPCQAFSVAGLRKGIDDPRGNLTLTFLGVLERYRPTWVVWENVPGVLSDRTNAFGQFIAGLSELGYGCAWRVLDAQYFGVAQRRRRVFVVGCLGDWRASAAVLFERDCLSGNPAPSREKGEGFTGYAESSIGGYRSDKVGGTLKASGGVLGGGSETFVSPVVLNDQGGSIMNIESENISPTLRRETHGHEPIISYSIQGNTIDRADTAGANGKGVKEEQAYTLNTIDRQAVAYSFDSLASNSMKSSNPKSGCRSVEVSKTIDTTYPDPSKNQGGIAVAHTFKIRSGCEGGGKGYLGQDEAAFTLDTTQSQNVMHRTAIRRLTPIDRKAVATINKKPVYDITKEVKIRKHEVDTEKLKQLLKSHKNQSNTSIAKALNVPKTKVDHWFRNDSSFAIPDAEIWFQLKQLLRINSDEFDESITEFIVEENKYDATNRVFDAGFPSPTLTASNSGSDNYLTSTAIRRLTPIECERLQGFPDNYTRIPYRGKNAEQCPDGPRYKALGNSMAVPVLKWIGERIDEIHRYKLKNMIK